MLRKIINNAILMSWASSLVRFGSPIFVIPLVLIVYSDVEQAFFWLTSSIIGFAMLADSGFGSITVRAVAYFKSGATSVPLNRKEYDEADEIIYGTPNFQKLKDLLTTTKRIYLILIIVVVILMLTGGVAAVWNIMKQGGHRIDLWIAYLLLIPYCTILISNIRWSSFMRGLDFVAQEARFSTLVSSMRILLFILFLSFKLKPMYLSLGFLLEGIATKAYIRYFVLKWFKENGITITNSSHFDKGIFRSLWAASWKMAGISWGNYFIDQGNSILVAQISDLKLMTNFLLTTRLLKMASGFSSSPVLAKTPVIFKLAAEKKMQELKVTVSRYMFLGLAMIIGSSLLLICFGNYGLEMINSDKRLMPLLLFAIMASSEILELHSTFHATIYTSTNHIPFLIPTLISGGAIFLGGYFFAMPLYGLAGIIVLRFLVQFSFDNFYALYLNLNFLKWPFLNYLYEMPYYGFKWVTQSVINTLTKKQD
jgi:O-antigen/teichoic acid export membrane protein